MILYAYMKSDSILNIHDQKPVNLNVKIKLIQNGKLPVYKTKLAAGADCFARLDQPITIKIWTFIKIPLGFAVELPEGYEMQIRGRSGLAINYGISCFNAPGTVDADYRGEIGTFLINCSNKDFIVNPGDRIAQIIICPLPSVSFKVVDKLSTTDRISQHGSTGLK